MATTKKNGITLKNIGYNDNKIKKAYFDGVLVFSAGALIAYYVDINIEYSEEIESGADAVTDYTTFTPTKDGWAFVGWREDDEANPEVLESKIVDADPFSLYAVFKKMVELVYYDNVSKFTEEKDAYSNNGNTLAVTFTVEQSEKTGWTPVGWRLKDDTYEDISYTPDATITTTEDMSICAVYKKEIASTFKSGLYLNATEESVDNVVYYDSIEGDIGAAITFPTPVSLTNWTWRGWSKGDDTDLDADVLCDAGDTQEVIESCSYYGLYESHITHTFDGNGATSGSVEPIALTAYMNSGVYGSTGLGTYLPNNGFVKTNHKFIGWKYDMEDKIFDEGHYIALNKGYTWYAQWEKPVSGYVPIVAKNSGINGKELNALRISGSTAYNDHPYWYNDTDIDIVLNLRITHGTLDESSSNPSTGYFYISSVQDSIVNQTLVLEASYIDTDATATVTVPAGKYLLIFAQVNSNCSYTASVA